MVSAGDNLLNLGIYTPAEAAFYARIRTQRINSWLYGSKNANPVVSPERWGEHSVKMNPRRHFGDPLLPSGYTAQAIWEAVKAEGSLEAAAKAYGVDRTEVELACSYLDFLQGTSAT